MVLARGVRPGDLAYRRRSIIRGWNQGADQTTLFDHENPVDALALRVQFLRSRFIDRDLKGVNQDAVPRGRAGLAEGEKDVLDFFRSYRYGGLTRADIGVVTEVLLGQREHDEPHVKVLLTTGVDDIWDLAGVKNGGRLVRKKGRVIIKWYGQRPLEVPEHQEWPMFALTEMGFALVRDPWCKPHCLP